MTGQRRCIGLDVHRDFAQVAIWQGGAVTQAGTFATHAGRCPRVRRGPGPADEVALGVSGNTWAIATVLASRAGRVVVLNPAKTRAIAEAKVKTDKVDAAILAQTTGRRLPAAGADARRPCVMSCTTCAQVWTPWRTSSQGVIWEIR